MLAVSLSETTRQENWRPVRGIYKMFLNPNLNLWGGEKWGGACCQCDHHQPTDLSFPQVSGSSRHTSGAPSDNTDNWQHCHDYIIADLNQLGQVGALSSLVSLEDFNKLINGQIYRWEDSIPGEVLFN